MHNKLAGGLLFLLAMTSNAATFEVTTSADSGPGSLRDAIVRSNATPGRDIITCSLKTFTALSAPLPTITDAVDLSGVKISGTNAGSAADGLVVDADGVRLSLVAITDFGGDGLVLAGDNSTVVSSSAYRSRNGVRISGSGNSLFACWFESNRLSGILVTATASGNVLGACCRSTTDSDLGRKPPIYTNSNGGDGITIEGTDNQFTWSASYDNGGDGVVVIGRGNRIEHIESTRNRKGFVYFAPGTYLNNQTLLNRGMSIDVNGDGPTANDAPDADGVLNAPVITSAVRENGVLIISGTLTSLPLRAFTVQVYEFDLQYNYQYYPVDIPVTTDANGHGSFRGSVWSVTDTAVAIATLPNRGTSEFSAAVGVTVAPATSADLSLTIAAAAQAGAGSNFKVTYRVSNNGPGPSGFDLWFMDPPTVTENGYWQETRPAYQHVDLLPGEETLVSRMVHINALPGSKLKLTAKVVPRSSRTPDPNSGNNAASVTVDVVEPHSRHRL